MHKIWLINLFGVPYAPSSFNPDNSLAALAGALKEGGFEKFEWKPLLPTKEGEEKLGEDFWRIANEAQPSAFLIAEK